LLEKRLKTYKKCKTNIGEENLHRLEKTCAGKGDTVLPETAADLLPFSKGQQKKSFMVIVVRPPMRMKPGRKNLNARNFVKI